MFETDEFKASSSQEIVTFSEMKHEEVEAFVEFLYSDGSTLSAKGKENVQSLFLAAHKYELLHLRDLCIKELISSLHFTNALDILMLSQETFERDLNIAAVDFILRNFKTIANSEEFKLFLFKTPGTALEIVKLLINNAGVSYRDSAVV
ncbi:unnamed protein product [Microthlaspi erraticum]|uniref:BTB domain-containing protein n=1 Tax=Microthlaspi erraticum TaxID=1685480 RepID=A0A6D2KK34_9BRAS|nr:unnamed protein product [Microthlaspi erraticum]